MAKVNVFTQAYNAEKSITRTINSIRSQSHPDWSWYIVNNGSSDKTGDIISVFAKIDSRIIVLQNKENNIWEKGNSYLEVLNSCYELDYFCWIDADDEYKPNFFTEMISFMAANDLQIAACGNEIIDLVTGAIVGERSLSENLILEDQGFSTYFPIFHQFMRTNWGKLHKISLLRQIDFENAPKLQYGGDTVFTTLSFAKAARAGIYHKSLHNYYISPKSVSYRFDDRRIESDRILLNVAQDFLIAKCGMVSDDNMHFLYQVYSNAIKDTVSVIFATQMDTSHKLSHLINIFAHPLTISFIDWKREMLERNQLVTEVAAWVLTQSDTHNVSDLKKAASIMAAIRVYPNNFTGWTTYQAFVLLAEIKVKITQRHIPCIFDAQLVALTASYPILSGIDINFLIFFRDIIADILQSNNAQALHQMEEVIAQESDIPEPFIETFITLGLNLSASLNATSDFIYFNKLQISFLLASDRLAEARTVLSGWSEILPDDVDFAEFAARLSS